MTQKIDYITGGWWKFTEYEIKNDFIQPAPGATLEWYEPWDLYHASKVNDAIAPPYQALLRLAVQLGTDYSVGEWAHAKRLSDGTVVPRAGIGLTPMMEGDYSIQVPLKEMNSLRQLHRLKPDSARLLCDWCASYGLLGILPHAAEYVQLVPRWSSEPTDDRETFAKAVTHRRENGSWFSTIDPWWTMADAPGRPGDAVGQEYWQEGPSEEGIARIKGLDAIDIGHFNVFECSLSDDRIAQDWGAYFPSIPRCDLKAYLFPTPLTRPFWKLYSEPVEVFIEHILIFQQATEPLSLTKPTCDVVPAEVARQLLLGLLAPIGIDLQWDGQIPTERWVCPSLLSSFAKMAVQDLAAGARILRCACCNGPFVTDKYQAQYCSKACGWRHRKRRARSTAETVIGRGESLNGQETRK